MQNLFCELAAYLQKPALYASDGVCIWNDEHVSEGLLQAHLAPDNDAATRKHAFLDRSVRWIVSVAPPSHFLALLDLGCGPGLYAERFANVGYAVTGVDLSCRSIAYAKEQADLRQSGVRYLCQNYLTLDFAEQFDVATLIYCDYGALCKADRLALLGVARRALKPNGKLIFDVSTPKMRNPEGRSWQSSDTGGFWSAQPHLCLEAVYQYDDEDRTELRQTVVCTQDAVKCYYVWDHFFSRDTLQQELASAGFCTTEFVGDVAGAPFSLDSETICCVATK